jgi:electron transfer flavoprotein alpha subunit
MLGSGAQFASQSLLAATQAWWCETGDAFRAGALAQALVVALESVPLVLMPASPDGRDLAPRVAAAMRRPLLAGAERVTCRADATGCASRPTVPAARVDDSSQLLASAVATLLPGSRHVEPAATSSPAQWGPELQDGFATHN